MKALLISNGSINDYNTLKNLVNEHEYIICADGGISHLIKIDEVPDVVIGDLDSVNKDELLYIKRNNIKTIKHPRKKNNTDTELSISYIINQGIRDITLTGVIGSRIDHTIANIFLLKDLSKKGIKTRIINDFNIIYFVNNYIKIKRKGNTNISIIPLSDNGIIVTLEGFLYSIDKQYINFGSTLGISNEILDDYGYVKIDKGEALVVEAKD